MKYIPYGYQTITRADVKAVVEVMKSDYLTQGPKVGEFEKNLAKKVGAKYAVAVNSGTAALHAAYFAAGLTKGDNIITAPITFPSTSNAAMFLGAKAKFVDTEPDTGNINVNKVEKKIDKKTIIIAPIHYSGHPVDLEPINKIAKKHGVIVVEDAAQALGTMYKGSKIGSCKYSDMTIFSFHPVKHITTGEGGAITTNNKKYYERLMVFRTHGVTKEKFKRVSPGGWYFEMQHLGFNYRITDFQAALGTSQLKKLDGFVKKRREIAKYYNQAFSDNAYFDTPPERDYVYAVYHLYPIRIKEKYLSKKPEIFDALRKNGIGVQTHHIPVHTHPYYRENGHKNDRFPVAERFYDSEISLPIFPLMSKSDMKTVARTVNKVLQSIIL